MNILITAGPTREHIDDVRFISNASSGRMGYALAAVAAKRGHRVELVSGPVDLPPPEGVEPVRVTSADEMRREVLARAGSADVFVMAAAVSDWRPKDRLPGKADKGPEESSLALVRNPDILREATGANPELFAVAFALETEMDARSALEKMSSKGARMVVLNTIEAMGAGEARFAVYAGPGNPVISAELAKEELADALLALLEKEKSS